MTPRPYQQSCIEATRLAFRENKRVLDVLPTGAGKTCIFSWMAQERFARGQKTLILAHREELIDQAIDKLHAATGIRAEKEKAESNASLLAPVVVASVQTMIRRLDKWPADHFSLVVADEAHHALSDSWQAVLRRFAPADHLGVTATPYRSDKRELGSYFQTTGYEILLYGTPDKPGLVDMGYLAPIALKSIPLSIDISSVGLDRGDLDRNELGSALEPYLGAIAQAIKQHASFRRVLAFLPLIATSQKFVEACRAVGLNARHVDGESTDRKEALAAFAACEHDLLSNAMLLTEGYDDPGIDCIAPLRPTKSPGLYCQMVGRGTRLHETKENLLLLDFLWNHEKHKLCRPAHLIAKTDEEAQAITEIAQEQAAAIPADVASQVEMDLRGIVGKATAEREEALRKRLEDQRAKKAKFVSAEDFALQHHSLETAEFEPLSKWEQSPATEKQVKYLRQAKIDIETVRGRAHASQLLGLYFRDKPLQLASEGQKATMRRLGAPNWEHATASEARQFFAGLRGEA